MRALAGICVLLGALSSGAAAPPKPRVVIIKSGTGPAYQQVTAGFMAQVSGLTDEVQLPESGGDPENVLKRLAASKPAMVLALGPQAAVAARDNFPNTPIVFALVPQYEKYDLVAPNVTGIAYTSSLQMGMEGLRTLDKKARRLGVIYDPNHSASLVSDIQDAVLPLGFKVVRIEIDEPVKVDRALKAARKKVDAMLMLPDATTGTEKGIASLVAFARDEHIALVGLSPAHVQQGALFALSPSYIGLGEQAGRLGNRLIHEKVNPGALAIAQPEAQELAMNMKTLQRISLVCDTALGAFRMASSRGYTLKVFP